MRQRRPVPLLVALVLVGASVRCSSGGPDNAGPATTVVVAGPPSGPAYNSVTDLAQTLTARDLPCTLDYPAQRDPATEADLGACTVSGDAAQLRVWTNPEGVMSFLTTPASRTGAVVAGPNWAVSLTTDVTANSVASALGGTIVPARPA